MISHIHHLNFLVRDLDAAVHSYQTLLGLGEFQFDELPQRKVNTARIRLGQTWLVLVQPTDQDSVPARHLAEHGEGFFLLSLATDDLDETLQKIEQQGGVIDPARRRTGLDGWQIADLEPTQFQGIQLQLTEEK